MQFIFVPGLGADSRIFEKVLPSLPDSAAIDWIEPLPVERLEEYAKRLVQTVTPSSRCIVVGFSFGGTLAPYIAKEIQAERCILLSSVKSGKKLPRLMFGCGEADSLLYGSYIKFRKHCDEIGLKADWFHLPGYKHEWAFWDLAIQHALDFFELPDDGGNPF